jgi:O-acetyl-ADP-ribose deacetylase (regulator of RNase III)
LAEQEIMSQSMTESTTVNKTVIRLIQADITTLEVESFLFYARTNLSLGSGFGTAIARRGGSSIKKELDKIGQVQPTEAVITAGGELPAKYIVHAAGPAFQEEDRERKLEATLRNALQMCEGRGIRRIALPPMGAGFYGIPLPVCVEVMLRTLSGYLANHTGLEEVILCANDMREYRVFAERLAAMGRASISR